MKVSIKTSLFCFFTIVAAYANGQQLDSVVRQLARINEVDYSVVCNGGHQYSYFLKMKALADTTQLLRLTDHPSSAVACYACWALADMKYQRFNHVLFKFLNNGMMVTTFSGCIKSSGLVSEDIYNRYWNSIPDEQKSSDKILLSLDSTVLYNENTGLPLISKALANRIYPRSFNRQIGQLAFKKTNKDAIFYLDNWYKADYKEEIKTSLLKYLQETDFKNVGVAVYYEVIEELLKFNDDHIRAEVITKLKKDKTWDSQKGWFGYLFDKYYISLVEVE